MRNGESIVKVNSRAAVSGCGRSVGGWLSRFIEHELHLPRASLGALSFEVDDVKVVIAFCAWRIKS